MHDSCCRVGDPHSTDFYHLVSPLKRLGAAQGTVICSVVLGHLSVVKVRGLDVAGRGSTSSLHSRRNQRGRDISTPMADPAINESTSNSSTT